MRATFAGKRRIALSCLAVGVLITVACSGAGPEATPGSSSVPSETAPGPDAGPAVGRDDQEAGFLTDLPAKVANAWGVTSVEKYLDISGRRTADNPYGSFGGGYSVIGLSLSERIRWSQAVVVGTIVEISPPYFNSADGGFWHPQPPSEVGRSIQQNIAVDVERVFGDTAAIVQGGLIAVTIAGGQIEVSFDASVEPGLLPEGFEAGRTYVEGMAPYVDVAEGDRVLLFLQRSAAPWFGAPVNSDMPWGKANIAGCPAVPVGTRNLVGVNHAQVLGAGEQQAAFQDGMETRTVTLDELEALARDGLGGSIPDPSAPVSPDNFPRPTGFDNAEERLDESDPPPARVCAPATQHPPMGTPDHSDGIEE